MWLWCGVAACGIVVVVIMRFGTSADVPDATTVAMTTAPDTVAPIPVRSSGTAATRFVPKVPPSTVPVTPHPEPVADSGLSPAVLAITDTTDRSMDYNAYAVALRQLQRDLSPADVSALMGFLRKRAVDHPRMRPIAFNGIKNDVLDVLLRQDTLPDGIGNMLLAMYRDKTHDEMWRDYCVQFMSTYYEVNLIGTGNPEIVDSKPSSNEREAIEGALWEALNETATTIAGTALLGLDYLAAHESGVVGARVGEAALTLLEDPSTGEPARITAFAVAASHQIAAALPEARVVAQTGETVPLQMAAIALIGQLGSNEDLELLAALAWNADARVKRIATTALESVRRRLARQVESIPTAAHRQSAVFVPHMPQDVASGDLIAHPSGKA